MATAIYNNCYTCWNGCSADAGDKCGCLRSWVADTNDVVVPAKTVVAYIDIVTAGGDINAGGSAQCDVVVACCVVQERMNTGGGVEVAGGVARERIITDGRIIEAGGVAIKRINAGSGVAVTGGIAEKRIKTDARIGVA